MSTCNRIFTDIRQIGNRQEILRFNQPVFTELAQVLALADNEARLKILFLLH